ncbi:MAG: DUF4907 domain-containing protein [Bacteroidota bacterium]
MGLLLGLNLLSCQEKKAYKERNTSKESNDIQQANSVLVDVITFRSGDGWGYTVNVNGKRYLYQATIPAVGGNKAFSSADKARKTGQLAAYKVKVQHTDPTISIEELDSLGVLD